jgi:hypothetical protein
MAFMISARTVQSRGTALKRRGGQGVMCWIRAEGRPLSFTTEDRASECESFSETGELSSAADDPHPAARLSARPPSPASGRGKMKSHHPAAIFVITAIDGGK